MKRSSHLVSFLLLFLASALQWPAYARADQLTQEVSHVERLLKEAKEASEKANYSEAQIKYEGALKLAEQLKDNNGIAEASFNLGAIYNRGGQHDKAIDFLQTALSRHEELGDKRGMGVRPDCDSRGGAQ